MQENNSSLDSILDGTLDDLADMPEFKNFADGAHKVLFDYEEKVVNKKPSLELKFTYVETVELADAAAVPPKQGDTANVLLMFKNNDGTKNEFSEGTLKDVVGALKPVFGGNSNRETLAAAKGAEVIIVTALKENKQNPGNFNMRLKAFNVA